MLKHVARQSNRNVLRRLKFRFCAIDCRKEYICAPHDLCNMRRAILSLLICCPIFLSAQNTALKFHHVSTGQGLSNNDVRTIFQDSKGFLWIGTLRGLNKYDGYRFTVYEHDSDNDATLAGNTIDDIVEDADRNLWIVTDKPCLSRLHLPTNTIKRYSLNKLAGGEINDLLVDGASVWVGYEGGIGMYNKKEDRFDLVALKKGGDYLNVTSIVTLNDSTLALGTSGSDELIFYNKHRRTVSFYHYGSTRNTPAPEGNERKVLLNDGRGNIWVGGLIHGLYKITLDRDTSVIRYTEDHGPFKLSSNSIRSLMYNDRNQELWIGTDGGGLTILNTRDNTGHIQRYNDSNNFGLSSGNGIYSIYRDKNDITWLGLYNGGLNYCTDTHKKFNSFTHNQQIPASISNNTVMSLLEDDDGRIWVGTDGGGLNEFDVHTGTFRRISCGTENVNVIASIEDAGKNQLLIGTWAKGLYLFDKLHETFTSVPIVCRGGKENMNKSAWDILKIANDDYWIATIDGGLISYNHASGEAVVRNDIIRPTRNDVLDARTLYKDKTGNVWVGTHQAGVVKITSTGHHVFLHKAGENSIASNDVRSILEDNTRNIWFGTQDKGLCKLDAATKQFCSVNVLNGLPDNTIQSILEDNSGSLWLTGPKGIVRYTPGSQAIIHFDKSDGLPGNDFKYNARLKLRDGRLLFGGAEGLVMFQPDSILLDHKPLTIVFTDFLLFNKSVNNLEKGSPLKQSIGYQRKIELSHSQSSFAIEFAALNFLSADKNEYAFKLEGFDKEWNYVNNKHEATYTNIPPGRYRFVVKASNHEGVWSDAPDSLNIVILPPWWRTEGAYVWYVVTIVMLLFFLRRAAILKERTRNRYENSLNKLRLLSNISHDLKTPLSLIQEPLKDLLQHDANRSMAKRHEKYLLINRHVHRMKRIVDQFMQMAREDAHSNTLPQDSTRDFILFVQEIVFSFKLHAEERNVLLRFNSNIREVNFRFNETHLENILYNVLSNAFKFTPDRGSIAVHVRLMNSHQEELTTFTDHSPEYIQVSVRDSGIGIAKEKLDQIFERHYFEESIDHELDHNSGLGLAITKEMVEMYNGTIHVRSEKNHGTEFIIQFPVSNKILGREKAGVVAGNTSAQQLLVQELEEKISADQDKPLVLIVEDDIAFRLQLMREFALLYRLSDAEDGADALRKIKESPPDLIISDVNMPNVNGLDLCKAIKSKVATSHIPIVLLTAFKNGDDQLHGIEHGADGYIEKPVSMLLLKAQVKNLLESRQQLRVKFQNTVDVDPREYTFNKIDNDFLNALITYIDAHIADPGINAVQLTKAIGISRSLLYSKLKELTGESVNSFITNIRIKKSISFLVKEHSISETAYLVGFSSYSYFVRSFKKQLGKSPTQYVADLKIKHPVS